MASIAPISGPSLKEILLRHGLKLEDLEKECPGSVRDEVAAKLDDWEVVGRYLEFTLEKLRHKSRKYQPRTMQNSSVGYLGKEGGKKSHLSEASWRFAPSTAL